MSKKKEVLCSPWSKHKQKWILWSNYRLLKDSSNVENLSAELESYRIEADKLEYSKDGSSVRAWNMIQAKGLGTHTEQEWIELCEYYRWTCICCFEKKPLTKDHIIPVSQGGSDSIENIQPLCFSCNARKHTKSVNYRKVLED